MTARSDRGLAAASAVALLALVLGACAEPDEAPEPQFSSDDALPSELVAGHEYEAQVTVMFPPDWPAPDESGRSASVGLTVDLGTGEGPVICDSAGLRPEERSVTLTCAFTPQVPTLGVQLGAHAATPDAAVVDGRVEGISVEHVYLHTVAPG